MLSTAAPRTCPAGSKPTLLIEVNSSAVRAEPQVPLLRISAIRAVAAGGSPFPGWSTDTLRPLVGLLPVAPSLHARAAAAVQTAGGPGSGQLSSPGHLSCA